MWDQSIVPNVILQMQLHIKIRASVMRLRGATVVEVGQGQSPKSALTVT